MAYTQLQRIEMTGIDAFTGVYLSGIDHLRQSVADILQTPKGTRVMRREYGSNLPYLVDMPMNRQTFAQIYYEVADALNKWEPRLRLKKVQVTQVTADGNITLTLEGTYLGTPVSLSTEILRI